MPKYGIWYCDQSIMGFVVGLANGGTPALASNMLAATEYTLADAVELRNSLTHSRVGALAIVFAILD